MDANQRSIFGGFFRGLTVALAVGVGAYLVVNAQRRANSNAHESAPAPQDAAQSSSTPADPAAESGAGELTPEQILLFSSKSAVIEPAPEQEAEESTFLHSSKVPHLTPADVIFVPWSADELPPFFSSSKTLNPELIRSEPTSPPVGAEQGLLFGSKSGLILPPVVAPAPTTPLLGSSKRLEPLTSQPSGSKPAASAPTDAKPKQP